MSATKYQVWMFVGAMFAGFVSAGMVGSGEPWDAPKSHPSSAAVVSSEVVGSSDYSESSIVVEEGPQIDLHEILERIDGERTIWR